MADQVQREIVADLIIVTVIMNEENDLNFAQSGSNEESVDLFSKENKENIVETGGCLDHHHPQRQ